MRTKNFAWFIMALMAAILAFPRITFAQDERRYERREEWRRDSREDRRRLEGTWYLNGERDKPCMIVSTHDGFEARNERGEAVDSCMTAMGLSERVTGKADCVAKFDAKALNGRMAPHGHGSHLVVRSVLFFPRNAFGLKSCCSRYRYCSTTALRGSAK